MSYVVDFINVSPVGLESSPVADALAGLRANEARYFKNKYDHDFTVTPASGAAETIDWVSGILKDERDIVIAARPLEATTIEVENIRWTYVFYEDGLSIDVLDRMVNGAVERLVARNLWELDAVALVSKRMPDPVAKGIAGVPVEPPVDHFPGDAGHRGPHRNVSTPVGEHAPTTLAG